MVEDLNSLHKALDAILFYTVYGSILHLSNGQRDDIYLFDVDNSK